MDNANIEHFVFCYQGNRKNICCETNLHFFKPLSGLCVVMLVDRGHLKFDDPVSKYWPEFAQNGKSGITIKQILGHEVS